MFPSLGEEILQTGEGIVPGSSWGGKRPQGVIEGNL